MLCGVALHQVYLSRVHGLSPWTGGGFGMFSTTDVGPQRRLRVYLVAEDGPRELGVPVPLEDRAERAAALPTPDRLGEFGRQVALDRGGAVPSLSAVRVELWRTRFDPDGLVPQPELLRRVDVDWDAGGP